MFSASIDIFGSIPFASLYSYIFSYSSLTVIPCALNNSLIFTGFTLYSSAKFLSSPSLTSTAVPDSAISNTVTPLSDAVSSGTRQFLTTHIFTAFSNSYPFIKSEIMSVSFSSV